MSLTWEEQRVMAVVHGVWVSVKLVAENANLSEKTTRRVLAQLVRRKLLVSRRLQLRGGPRGYRQKSSLT